jgi:hypothetical protein
MIFPLQLFPLCRNSLCENTYPPKSLSLSRNLSSLPFTTPGFPICRLSSPLVKTTPLFPLSNCSPLLLLRDIVLRTTAMKHQRWCLRRPAKKRSRFSLSPCLSAISGLHPLRTPRIAHLQLSLSVCLIATLMADSLHPPSPSLRTSPLSTIITVRSKYHIWSSLYLSTIFVFILFYFVD